VNAEYAEPASFVWEDDGETLSTLRGIDLGRSDGDE